MKRINLIITEKTHKVVTELHKKSMPELTRHAFYEKCLLAGSLLLEKKHKGEVNAN